MNTCHIHTDRDAAGTCAVCGRFFCEECLVPVSGTHICKDCVGSLIVDEPEEKTKKPAKPEPPLKCYSIYVGLALILGVTGAHSFYCGKTGTGVTMLVISAVLSIFTSSISLPPIGLFIIEFIAFLQAFQKEDGYGRPMV